MKRTMVKVTVLVFAIALAPAHAQTKHSFWMKGAVIDVQGKNVTLCIGEPGAAKVGQKLFVSRMSKAAGPKNAITRSKIGTVKIVEIFDEHMAKAEVIKGDIKYGDLVALVGED